MTKNIIYREKHRRNLIIDMADGMQNNNRNRNGKQKL